MTNNMSFEKRELRLGATLTRGLAGVALLGCSAQASAMTADLAVFDTGVDDSGVPLGIGVPDSHYAVWFEDISNQAPAVTRLPLTGWASPSGNQWDTVPTPGINGRVGTGPFTYQTTFDMPAGAELGTASLAGQWAAGGNNTHNGSDTILSTAIRLNGVDVGTGTSSGVLSDFAIGSNFVPGENLLQFVIELGPAGAGPIETGLLVDITEATVSVVPIPAAVWLFGSALVGLGVAGKRRASEPEGLAV